MDNNWYIVSQGDRLVPEVPELNYVTNLKTPSVLHCQICSRKASGWASAFGNRLEDSILWWYGTAPRAQGGDKLWVRLCQLHMDQALTHSHEVYGLLEVLKD